ncbi:MAG TPA: LptA/OstA family protein, partial [Desulfosalsimonadaceae bacterium]|nr:LptA/OstA family protein [Desulfosalsimonadaceae bacterium]
MKTQNQKVSRISCWLILLTAAIFAATDATGQSETLPLSKGSGKNAPWRITADRLTYDKAEKIYTATGGVIIEKGATKLFADSVRFNQSTMQARASGNVQLLTRGDRLTGTRMALNLNSQTGTIYDGLIFIEKKNFYIRGDKIQKTGKDHYAINRGSLTSCNQEVPDWQVTGRDLVVNIEGYGSVNHAALWAKKLPVAYLPYFIFPVKRNRQSGFLSPEIGYSDRNGIEFIQPYYWAIHRSCDATFYYHHIQNRGEKLGAEFRYRLSPESQGALMFDGMEDRKVDDAESANADWGYGDDRYLRPNSDRYWFRMKADQALPYGMDGQLDLDIVSDQDYLREFEDGYTGYDDTNDYFESEFGRDLDDNDDPVRENRAHLQKIWPRYSFNADLLWYDNVIKRRQ